MKIQMKIWSTNIPIIGQGEKNSLQYKIEEIKFKQIQKKCESMEQIQNETAEAIKASKTEEAGRG